MFYGGVAEKEGPIVVPDVDPSAFKAMLQWVLQILRSLYPIKLLDVYIIHGSV